MPQMPSSNASQRKLHNYLRTYRKKAGLSLREMGMLLAYVDESAVARHESAKTLPPLFIALSYEALFQAPVSKLFPGMRETAGLEIEQRLLRFEEDLLRTYGKDSRASHAAQKLAWLSERRNMKDE